MAAAIHWTGLLAEVLDWTEFVAFRNFHNMTVPHTCIHLEMSSCKANYSTALTILASVYNALSQQN